MTRRSQPKCIFAEEKLVRGEDGIIITYIQVTQPNIKINDHSFETFLCQPK
jgi:hypothetical protein